MDVFRIVMLIYAIASPVKYKTLPPGDAFSYASAFVEVSSNQVCDVDIEVLLAFASYENRWFNASIASRTDDVGLMQIHARSKKEIKAFKDPTTNIKEACRRLSKWKRGRSIKGKTGYIAWFQKYNSRSKGYGERVYARFRYVKTLLRQIDKAIDVSNGASVAQRKEN